MNNRLYQIQNWPELAMQAGYSPSKLAKNCGVSLRTLRRFFWKNLGKSPKAWLFEQRQQHAAEMAKCASSIKETATDLGYKYPTHFSRDFKKHWGICPTQTGQSSPET